MKHLVSHLCEKCYTNKIDLLTLTKCEKQRNAKNKKKRLIVCSCWNSSFNSTSDVQMLVKRNLVIELCLCKSNQITFLDNLTFAVVFCGTSCHVYTCIRLELNQWQWLNLRLIWFPHVVSSSSSSPLRLRHEWLDSRCQDFNWQSTSGNTGMEAEHTHWIHFSSFTDTVL